MDIKKTYGYLRRVLQDGSISLAAEQLAITQPALSKCIKKIESELGTQILDRSTVPVTLTEAGKCYMEALERTMDVNAQLDKKLSDLEDGRNTHLRVGISPSRAPFLLPVILAAFGRENGVHVTVVEAATAELGEALTAGRLDLVIGVEAEGYREAFEKTVLFEEEMLLAVPETLRGEPFGQILSHAAVISSGKGQPMDRLLASLPAGMTLQSPVIECRNMLTAIALTAAGVGVTPVPSYMRDMGGAYANVAFLPLPAPNGSDTREVCVFYRKRQYVSKAERMFIDAALRAVGGRTPAQYNTTETEN